MKVLNDQNFQEETNKGIVVVDLYAKWCGPCQPMGVMLDEISEEITDVHFFKVDVDESPATSEKFGVRSIPYIVILKDGEIVDEIRGFTGNKEDYVKAIMKAKA